VAGSRQEQPRAARSSQEQPVAARNSQRKPRSCFWSLLGVSWVLVGPGVPWVFSWVYPWCSCMSFGRCSFGVPGSSLEFLAAPWCSLGAYIDSLKPQAGDHSLKTSRFLYQLILKIRFGVSCWGYFESILNILSAEVFSAATDIYISFWLEFQSW
jgi:hypothetical protein